MDDFFASDFSTVKNSNFQNFRSGAKIFGIFEIFLASPYSRDYKIKLTRWHHKLMQSSSKYHFVKQSKKIILTLLYTASEESSVSITMITIPIIPNIRA